MLRFFLSYSFVLIYLLSQRTAVDRLRTSVEKITKGIDQLFFVVLTLIFLPSAISCLQQVSDQWTGLILLIILASINTLYVLNHTRYLKHLTFPPASYSLPQKRYDIIRATRNSLKWQIIWLNLITIGLGVATYILIVIQWKHWDSPADGASLIFTGWVLLLVIITNFINNWHQIIHRISSTIREARTNWIHGNFSHNHPTQSITLHWKEDKQAWGWSDDTNTMIAGDVHIKLVEIRQQGTQFQITCEAMTIASSSGDRVEFEVFMSNTELSHKVLPTPNYEMFPEYGWMTHVGYFPYNEEEGINEDNITIIISG